MFTDWLHCVCFQGLGNVVEKDHSLILGWTSFTVQYILEICLANESEGGGVIVVLDDVDKEVVTE